MFKNYRIRDYDFKLILMMIAVTVIGILSVGSARPDMQNKQILGFLTGLFIMIVISFFDYSFFLRFYWLIYGFNLALLFWVWRFGKVVNRARRWIVIAGIQFQPSETAKIMLILFYAQFIMKHKDKINSPQNILLILLLLAPPAYLIYDEPDLSTTIVLLSIFCVVWYVGGLSYKLIFGVLAVAVPVVVILFILVLQPDQTIISSGQQLRILAWLYPNEYSKTTAYQQTNAIMAIGSGQLWGKGLNNNEISSVKNGNFVSEPQTDFIFSVIGEEMGFIIAGTVIILYVILITKSVYVAKTAKDDLGSYIAIGIAGIFLFHMIENIGMTMGLLPITGVPLPFVSYGGSSLVTNFICIALLLNISGRRQKTIFVD